MRREARRRRSRWLALALVSSSLLSACGSGNVQRKNQGQQQAGRNISSSAFSWYLRGRQLEAHGEISRAQIAYREAMQIDPQAGSPRAAWARLRGKEAPEEASRKIEKWLKQVDEKSPLYLARAECEAARGNLAAAEEAARLAILYDPGSAEATLVLASLLTEQARLQEAELVRRSFENLHQLKLPPAASEQEPPQAQLQRLVLKEQWAQAEALALEESGLSELLCTAYQMGRKEYARTLAKRILAGRTRDVNAELLLLLDLGPSKDAAQAELASAPAPKADDSLALAPQPPRLAPACARLLDDYLARAGVR